MKFLARYDGYLKRLAFSAAPLDMRRIHIVCLPWFVAGIGVRVAYDLIGHGSMTVTVVWLAVSILLLVGLFWSGFRYLGYRTKRRQEVEQAKSAFDDVRGT